MPTEANISQSSYVPIHYGKLATNFSKTIGGWLLANVDQNIGWPQRKVVIIYRGRKVLLLPATKKYYAAAAVITEDQTLSEGKTFLMQFLSALAWRESGKLNIICWTNTQGHLTNFDRMPLNKQPGITSVFFRPSELPDPKNPQAQLAIALFREGLSLNHVGYSFLSYFKIINLRYPKDEKQKKFIKRSLPLIENLPHLKDKFTLLKAQHTDLVNYIYKACRCAVAHASKEQTTYDPENVDDENRFYEIQPIAHALAKLIIETEFGIKNKFTILKEHLYELEGFYQVLGDTIAMSLKAGNTLPLEEIKLNTTISLRLWNKPKLKAFENLQITVSNVNAGAITLSLTRDSTVKFQITLDFPKEKLIFDPTQTFVINDDGSKNAALQISNAYQFYSEFFGNPVLEIWDMKSGMILGRLLEYLPKVQPGQPMPHIMQEQYLLKMKEWRQRGKERATKNI